MIIADYLSPIIPLVKRFRFSNFGSDDQIEDQAQKELYPAQINRLIQIEIDKLNQENMEGKSNEELANLVWEA